MATIPQSWRADESVYLTAKKLMEQKQTVNQPIPSYYLLDGGPSDYRRVSEFFQRSAPVGYTLTKVEVILNRALDESFGYVLQGLLQEKPIAKIGKKKEETKEKEDLRVQFAGHLDKQSAQDVPRASRLKLLPLFHGSDSALLKGIFEIGYNIAKNGSPGPLGEAIYHTSSGEYAQRVHSSGVLLLNWVAISSPRFICSHDQVALKGSADCDAYYSLVAPLNPQDHQEVVYRPIGPGENAVYDELAVFEPEQILPRYLLSVTRVTPLKHLSSSPSKEALYSLFLELFKSAQADLSVLLQMEIAREHEDKSDNLRPAELWLYAHIGKVLHLEKKSVEYTLLIEKIQKFLRLLNPKKRIEALELVDEKDQDYLKGIKCIRSGDFGQYATAVECFTLSAKNGHLGAHFELGKCHLGAMGVKKDENKGIGYIRYAANRGHVEAQFLVSQLLKGHSFKEAIRYAKAAAKQGHAEAQDYVGHCYYRGLTVEKNNLKAIKWFKLAAEQGNESSRYYLALCLLSGLGIPQDEKAAFDIWKTLADEGNVPSQFQVSQCYKLGVGIEKNYPLAIRYGLLAANQNHPEAQDYIGHCYYLGLTLPQDYAKAVYYFKLAAAQGNSSAKEYLGVCYSKGCGVDQDPVQAAHYYLPAADAGRIEAQIAIGLAYKNGVGVPVDLALAEHYLKLAAEQGSKEASAVLKTMQGKE